MKSGEGMMFLARLGVDDYGVTLVERSPAAVLSRQPHGYSLPEERSHAERFGHTPVHRDLTARHALPLFEQLEDLRVDVETRRHAGQSRSHVGQPFVFDPRFHFESGDVRTPAIRFPVGRQTSEHGTMEFRAAGFMLLLQFGPDPLPDCLSRFGVHPRRARRTSPRASAYPRSSGTGAAD